MINISEVKPGQRVTVRYNAPVTWARKTDNPYLEHNVTRAMEVSFTAAGEQTYQNMADKLGAETTGKAPWWAWAPNVGPCVVQHPGKGTLYLAGINHNTSGSLFVDGAPATPTQQTEIASYLREHQDRTRGLDFQVWTVDKLENACLAS